MNRVWTALLIALTVAVFGGVVYLLGHNTKVPEAGQTPGYAPTTGGVVTSASTTPTTPTTSSKASTSAVAATSSGSTQSTLIAFVGDDYTHGVGDSGDSKSFPALIASALHVQEKRFYLDNAGYAKSGSDGKSYADLVDQVIAAHPDIVVVSGGRNDRADDPNTLASKATALFAALKQGLPNAKLVAVAPWWGDSAHPSVLDQVGSAIKDAVTSAGGTYFDIDDPLFGHSEWMSNAADPNDQGYQAIAESLEPKLQPLLS